MPLPSRSKEPADVDRLLDEVLAHAGYAIRVSERDRWYLEAGRWQGESWRTRENVQCARKIWRLLYRGE